MGLLFPLETKIELDREKENIILHLNIQEAQDYIVEIIELSDDLFEKACLFIASQYQKREPLFLTLQRIFKKIENVDMEKLIAFLKERYNSHLTSCFIAVATPKIPFEGRRITQVEGGQPYIVGVCLCRVIPFNNNDNNPSFGDTFSNPVLEYFSDNIPAAVDNTTLLNMLSKEFNPQPGDTFDQNNIPAEVSGDTRSVFEIGMVAVDTEFCARKIAKGLVTKAKWSAENKQCSLIRCNCSNVFLERTLHNVGFTTVVELAFPDVKIGDSSVSVEIAYPHKCFNILGCVQKQFQ